MSRLKGVVVGAIMFLVGTFGYIQYWNWRITQPLMFTTLAENATDCGGSCQVALSIAILPSQVLRKYGLPVMVSELGWLTGYHVAYFVALAFATACAILIISSKTEVN